MAYELRSLIAQTHLKGLGFYHGMLDGDWGPLSKAAAEKWDDAELLKALPPAGSAPAASTPYSLARTHLGVKEIPGSKHNSLIVRWGRMLATWYADDETAWCSAFVNAMAREAGYEQSGKLNARSWLDVGVEVPIAKAKPGDVVIFWRVSKDSWEGHVAFLVSYNAASGTVRVLGGNQSNEVNVATYSTSMLLGVRRLRTLDLLQGNTQNRTV